MTWDPDNPIVWEDNHEIEATLRFVGFSRGRSAAYGTMIDESTGSRHCIFLADLEDLIQKISLNEGVASGRWTFTKRGRNYGIRMVFEE